MHLEIANNVRAGAFMCMYKSYCLNMPERETCLIIDIYVVNESWVWGPKKITEGLSVAFKIGDILSLKKFDRSPSIFLR